MKTKTSPRELEPLRKSLKACKRIIAFLIIIIAALLLKESWQWFTQHWSNLNLFNRGSKPPHYAKVKQIIEPLKYNGYYNLMRPDVKLTIDFENETWCLRNLHQFNAQGRIKLVQGCYGLCGELASYTYDEIRPLFDRNKYNIGFMRVAESGFFIKPTDSHIALCIIEKTLFGSKTYILDPSFRRYGPINEFSDYMFFEKMAQLTFVKFKNPDEVLTVGRFVPIIISRDHMAALMVDKNKDKFDQDNFVLALTSTKKHSFGGNYLLMLIKNEGETEIVENSYLGHMILGPKSYDAICDRLKQWFSEIK